MSLEAFDNIMKGSVKTFVALSHSMALSSSKIWEQIMYHSIQVEAAFKAQSFYIYWTINRHHKMINPDPDSITRRVKDVQERCSCNEDKEIVNHLSMVGESIPVLAWVQVENNPGEYVKEMRNTAVYYGNRVLMNFKNAGSLHVDWVKAWLDIFDELYAYIQEFHPKGLDKHFEEKLFLQVNKLKSVDEAGSGDGNRKSRKEPLIFKESANKNVETIPMLRQEGKKWMVMNYEDKEDLVIDMTECNNTVYMFKCEKSTLTIKGKFNSVTVDSCKKVSLILDSVIASVEFINCENVEMQVLDTVPFFIVEKTHGCQLYLSSWCFDAEIVSSQCSQLNVLLPDGMDYRECPVPEQIKTRVCKNGKLEFKVVEHKG